VRRFKIDNTVNFTGEKNNKVSNSERKTRTQAD